MPTPAEKKALLFVAGVALLGASVRAVRAIRAEERPSPTSAHALEQQLAAVDSARKAVQGKGRGAGRRGGMRRASQGDSVIEGRSAPSRSRSAKPAVLRQGTRGPIDLDIAQADDIEALPFVGPVLARRIVADREKRGAFGSLTGLRRVKGIGPALAAKLDSLVTFSGTPRHPSAAPRDSSLRRRADRSRPGAGIKPRPPPNDNRLPPAWLHQSSLPSASENCSFANASFLANSCSARSTSSG